MFYFSIYIIFNAYLIMFKYKIVNVFLFNVFIFILALIFLNYFTYRDYSGIDILLKSSGRFESWERLFSYLNILIFDMDCKLIEQF